jgi:hypothetical protein
MQQADEVARVPLSSERERSFRKLTGFMMENRAGGKPRRMLQTFFQYLLRI